MDVGRKKKNKVRYVRISHLSLLCAGSLQNIPRDQCTWFFQPCGSHQGQEWTLQGGCLNNVSMRNEMETVGCWVLAVCLLGLGSLGSIRCK